MEPIASQNDLLSRRRKIRRAYLALAAAALAAIGVYGGYRLWTRGRVSTDDAVVDADVVPLSLQVGGVVREVKVHDHQRFARGDVLVELDPADYQVRVREAEADLAAARAAAAAATAQVRIVAASSSGGLSSARAQLVGSGAGVKSARAQIDAASAAVARAEAEAREAGTGLTRVRNLIAKEAATTEELEAAETASAAATAAVAAARAQLAGAREQERGAHSRVAEAAGRVESTGATDAQVAAAQAQADGAAARVSLAEASLDQARLQLARTHLIAPRDGIASQLAVRAGQNVAAGQLALELVPPATYIMAQFKETEVGPVRPGQPVDIDVDSMPGRELHGVVDSISPATSSRFALLQPDNASGNFVKVVKRVPVKIRWSETDIDAALRPGMSAEVTVHTD
ncbi:MAG TPA: HlyD family efflux transporter periplasmic adaptor subunit [Kofleriaceae bacterium]|nr:HlyD family efflux transporter periplasmic adaptor subunit [Kofleriaceae bacterium]